MANCTTVVGYTADADTYCVDCAKRIYGDDRNGAAPVHDREGNEVQPIFGDSEWDSQPVCRACGAEIDARVLAPEEDEGEPDFDQDEWDDRMSARIDSWDEVYA